MEPVLQILLFLIILTLTEVYKNRYFPKDRLILVTSVLLSLILQAFVFGHTHLWEGKLRGIITTALSALLYGIVFILSGSLLTSIITHTTANTGEILLGYVMMRRQR
jgi:membrane protease YdiL (CAAX protease family)